jgi:hypothetical protein
VLVSCADKLDNIRSIRHDLGTIGETIWSRFKRPREKQMWYYTELVTVFEKRIGTTGASSLAAEYRNETEHVFGDGSCE